MSETDPGGRPAPRFAELYGRDPQVTALAPGRVNLIGEHTDYNGGFVLPTPIPQRTRVELSARVDRIVRVWSENLREDRPAEYLLGEEAAGRGWIDYVQGITMVLREEGSRLAGFDARIASEVPLGAGLASSAALEIALLRALRDAFDLKLDGRAMALLGRRAENDFVGARVGIMDQMVCSLGSENAALFLDARNLEGRQIPIPPDGEIGVVDSGVRHSHAGGEYGTRRRECEEAARLLRVGLLRDVQDAPRPPWERLPEPLNRRVRHVVTENARVLRATEALGTGDLPALGALFLESHRSLRDDFEVSIPELDMIVDGARADPAIHGARMTGGGFGGSVVLMGTRGETGAAARRVARSYGEKTGRAARVLLPLG
ncbi:MAG: galactokinase [Thermoanaerobaculia bacterium]